MSLFETLRDLFGSGRATAESENETFEYRCRNCDHEFESTQQHVTTASCPDCGSDDIRVRENPY